MSDLIDREAALDCFHDWIDRHGDVHTPDEMAEYRAIEELPSVEPEKRTEERTETHACDLISRQEAIDFIDAGHLCNPNEPRWSDNEIVNFLKSRPPAQPDLSEYSDKLWRNAYERGKRDAQPEIIRCEDCVHWWGSHKMCKWNKNKNHTCACMDCDADFYCKNAERREE